MRATSLAHQFNRMKAQTILIGQAWKHHRVRFGISTRTAVSSCIIFPNFSVCRSCTFGKKHAAGECSSIAWLADWLLMPFPADSQQRTGDRSLPSSQRRHVTLDIIQKNNFSFSTKNPSTKKCSLMGRDPHVFSQMIGNGPTFSLCDPTSCQPHCKWACAKPGDWQTRVNDSIFRAEKAIQCGLFRQVCWNCKPEQLNQSLSCSVWTNPIEFKALQGRNTLSDFRKYTRTDPTHHNEGFGNKWVKSSSSGCTTALPVRTWSHGSRCEVTSMELSSQKGSNFGTWGNVTHWLPLVAKSRSDQFRILRVLRRMSTIRQFFRCLTKSRSQLLPCDVLGLNTTPSLCFHSCEFPGPQWKKRAGLTSNNASMRE